VIKTLVISDFLTNAGFSVFAPIIAVFVTKQIEGGSLEIIGFAAAIFQVFKSVLQIPISRFLDKDHGEFDDFYSMIFGSLLIASVPFLYLLASQPIHVYLIQAVYGAGAAFAIPPWYAIFTRHIDKLKENQEWSLDSIAIGIGAATSAALGGILANRYGFQTVFIIGGFLAVLGAIQQMRIYKDLREKVAHDEVKPQPDKVPGS